MPMMSRAERYFLKQQRVGHLATADRAALPHVVPVCFALHAASAYITIDRKPKGPAAGLRRLRNIAENPHVALVVDRYDEDWTRLAWVLLRGRAAVLRNGAEHDEAQVRLGARYPQLAGMQIADLPVIAIRIAHVTSWGALNRDHAAR